MKKRAVIATCRREDFPPISRTPSHGIVCVEHIEFREVTSGGYFWRETDCLYRTKEGRWYATSKSWGSCTSVFLGVDRLPMSLARWNICRGFKGETLEEQV